MLIRFTLQWSWTPNSTSCLSVYWPWPANLDFLTCKGVIRVEGRVINNLPYLWPDQLTQQRLQELWSASWSEPTVCLWEAIICWCVFRWKTKPPGTMVTDRKCGSESAWSVPSNLLEIDPLVCCRMLQKQFCSIQCKDCCVHCLPLSAKPTFSKLHVMDPLFGRLGLLFQAEAFLFICWRSYRHKRHHS